MIPLTLFCGRRGLMGELCSPLWLQALSWLCAALIVMINAGLLLALLRVVGLR